MISCINKDWWWWWWWWSFWNNSVGLLLVTSPLLVASPLSLTLGNTSQFRWCIFKLMTLSHSLHVCFTWVDLLIFTKIVNVHVFLHAEQLLFKFCVAEAGCLNCTWLSRYCWPLNDLLQCLHLTLYTLTSVCIFSILFSIHFLRCWQGELARSKASVVFDHFHYSHDLSVWIRGDIVRRN